MGGGQEGVVAGREAHLEREQDRQPATLDQRQHALQRLARVRARIAYSVSVKRTSRRVA